MASLAPLTRSRIGGGLLPFSGKDAWIAVVTRRGVRGQMLAAAGLALLLVGLLVLCFRPAQHDIGSLVESLPTRMLPPKWLPGLPASTTQALKPEPGPLHGEVATVRNADTPMMALGPSARPFHFSGALPARLRARTCLAAAMLFEAGDDGAGQLAVGQVVLNRARHPAFPGSVCGVVLQGSERATGCQFTFTCDGALARSPTAESRRHALVRADLMLGGLVFAPVGLATHYHSIDVYPWWSPKLEKIARQGAHLFFRWPGYWGSARAVVARAVAEPSSTLFSRFDPEADRAIEGAESEDAHPSNAIEAHPSSARPPDMTDTAKASASAGLVPISRRLGSSAQHDTSMRTAVISTSALLGNRLVQMFPEQGIFFLELSPILNDGANRRVAEMLCGGRTDCRVYGWSDTAAIPATIQIGPDSAAKLSFRFVRKPAANGPADPGLTNAF